MVRPRDETGNKEKEKRHSVSHYQSRQYPRIDPLKMALAVTIAISFVLLPAFTATATLAGPMGSFSAMGKVMGDGGSRDWPGTQVISKVVEIPPGEDYVVHFDSSTFTLVDIDPSPNEEDLTDVQSQALGRVPTWLRYNLTRQFLELGDPGNKFAQLIVDETNTSYIDEIAFAIAHTSAALLKNHAYPDVFVDNAISVYDNDLYLDYVRLVEYGSYANKDYYTTTKYFMNDSGVKTEYELPMECYYWFIVHPRVSEERPTYVNPANGQQAAPPTGVFWRDYLFNHNDTDYPPDPGGSVHYPQDMAPPLLKAALANIEYLWNGTSHVSPSGYDNSGTTNNRPLTYGDHAIERVSNWVELTLPINQQESGDGVRPTTPAHIAHHHNGNCGELADLTTAASRTALIPSIEVLDIAQDHVWNEFYHDEWVHYDNWWSDGGSAFDRPQTYDGHWFDVSSVWAERGDALVWDVTPHYTAYANLTVHIEDSEGEPVDGARVMLVTNGRYDPETLTLSMYNVTDGGGNTTFLIGEGRNYWARVDTDTLGKEPQNQNSVTEIVQNVIAGQAYTFTLTLAQAKEIPQVTVVQPETGPRHFTMGLEFSVDMDTLHGKNAFTTDLFYDDLPPTPVEVFVLNASEYATYSLGEPVDGYAYLKALEGNLDLQLLDTVDQYLVISNKASLAIMRTVNMTVSLDITPFILLTVPENDRLVQAGTSITFEGVAMAPNMDKVTITLDNGTSWQDITSSYSTDTGIWEYEWDTSGTSSGTYEIWAKVTWGSGQSGSSTSVNVTVDAESPVITVLPSPGQVFQEGTTVQVTGTAEDDIGLFSLEISTGSGWTDITTSLDTESGEWTYPWDTTGLASAWYGIDIRATDDVGHVTLVSTTIGVDGEMPFLSISSPFGLEWFRGGTPVPVSGEVEDNLELAILEVSGDGGLTWVDITQCLDLENGTWAWTWNTTDLPSAVYGHVFRITDMAGLSNQASLDIGLDADPPEIHMDRPEEGALVPLGGTVEVSGTVEDNMEVISLNLSVDGGDTWIDLMPDLMDDDWMYMWEIPKDIQPGGTELLLEACDLFGNCASMNLSVMVADTEAPVLSIISPRKGMELELGTSVNVKGTALDNIAVVSFEFSDDGGSTWTDISDRLTGETWSHTWDLVGLVPGEVTVQVMAKDAAGNDAIVEASVELVDRTKPEVAIDIDELDGPFKEGDTIRVNGTAWDNVVLDKLEIRIDTGTWEEVTDLTEEGHWAFEVQDLGPGSHRIYVRAADSSGLQSEESVTVTVKPRSKGAADSGWLVPAALGVVVAIVVVLGLVFFLMRRKEGGEKGIGTEQQQQGPWTSGEGPQTTTSQGQGDVPPQPPPPPPPGQMPPPEPPMAPPGHTPPPDPNAAPSGTQPQYTTLGPQADGGAITNRPGPED